MRGCAGCRRIVVVLVAALTSLMPLTGALASSPYEAEITLEGVNEVRLRPTSTKSFDVIPTVKVSGKIRNVGRIEARFSTRRNPNWRSVIERNGIEVTDPIKPVLLRGKVAIGGGSVRRGRKVYASAASVINNELKVTFPGRARGSRKSWQRIYTIRVLLDGSVKVTAKVSSIPASAFHRGACGAAVGASHAAHGSEVEAFDDTIPPLTEEPAPIGEGSGEGAVLTKVLTVSTDADPEWYAKHGDKSNAVIASIINTAEAMYDRQLGLRFRIVKQHVYTGSSPYTSTDSGVLLRMFTGNSANKSNLGSGAGSFDEEVDLKHLFTGKDLDGSVIGIAYIGTVCAAPSLAYGITQDYIDGANAGIFAHELGHNFGAFHDASDRGGLMYPSISLPPSERLSDASLNEISEHLARNGSCISREMVAPRDDSPAEPTPAPTATPEPDESSPAILSFHQLRTGAPQDPVARLMGRVRTAAGVPIGALRVRLVVGGVNVGTVVTDDQGKYEFFVRFSIPKGRRVQAYVETLDSRLSSRYLWISPIHRAVGRARVVGR